MSVSCVQCVPCLYTLDKVCFRTIGMTSDLKFIITDSRDRCTICVFDAWEAGGGGEVGRRGGGSVYGRPIKGEEGGGGGSQGGNSWQSCIYHTKAQVVDYRNRCERKRFFPFTHPQPIKYAVATSHNRSLINCCSTCDCVNLFCGYLHGICFVVIVVVVFFGLYLCWLYFRYCGEG